MMTFLTNPRTHLPIILLIAVALRIGVLLALPTLFAFEQTEAFHGSVAYDDYAQNLRSTGVYGREPGTPDATLAPAYSVALAAVYATVGRSGLIVGLFHTLLDLVSIAALYGIGRRLFDNPWIAALGALFSAAYPYLIFQNLTLIDTPFVMVLLYGFLFLAITLRARASLPLALLAGAVLGVGLLARAAIAPIAVMVALWYLPKLGLRRTVTRLLPVALVSAACLLPWILRNATIYDAFVPFALNGGENFYQGNNPLVVPYLRAGYDAQWIPPVTPDGAPVDFGPLPEQEKQARLAELGADYLRAADDIPTLLWVKFRTHWSIDVAPRRNPVAGEVPPLNYDGSVAAQTTDDGLSLQGLPQDDPVNVYSEPLFDRVGRTLHRVYFGGLLTLALVGTVVGWRGASLVWLIQLANTVVYVVFHPSTRYRAPTDPLLFLLSAAALVAAGMWILARRRGTVAET